MRADFAHDIVKELRAVRIARRVSRAKLGKLAGYSENHIWNIEHGKQGVRIEIVADLAQALGMRLKLERADD